METFDIHSPTTSELATFQVLANLDFVNLNKQQSIQEEDYEFDLADVRVVDDDEFFELPPPPSPKSIQKEDEEEKEEKYVSSPKLDFVPPTPVKERTPISSPLQSVPRSSRPQRDSSRAEIEAEKEGLLAELQNLEKQGYKMVRPLTINDSLEEIQFQYDRIQSELNANQMVDFAKSSIKMGSGMIEMLMKKSGLKVVDGYHTNLCKDMNKFNRPLNRLYKKYWRRGGISPEAELGLLVFGSLAYTVIQNKMSSTTLFGGSEAVPEEASQQFKSESTVKTPLKPPQMNSLNVPNSWSTVPPTTLPNVSQPNSDAIKASQLLKSAEEKMRQLELSREDMNQREMALRKFMVSIDEKTAKLELREAELDARENEGVIDSEVEDHAPPRKIVLQTSATPKKSAKRKTVALELS